MIRFIAVEIGELPQHEKVKVLDIQLQKNLFYGKVELEYQHGKIVYALLHERVKF